MKISKIMRKAIVIDSSISVKDAAKIMSKKGIGCLIVTKNNKIKGIITERDIIKNIPHLNYKISKIMSKKVRTISPDENIEKGAEILSKYNIKRLPVIENRTLKGIVTITDILGHCGNIEELNEDFLIN